MVTTIAEHIKVLDRDYGGFAALGGPLIDSRTRRLARSSIT